MRRYIIFPVVIILALVFSGCVNDGNGEEEMQTLAPSVWKSSDSGKSWEVKNTGVGEMSNLAPDVLSLAINPNDPNHVRLGLRSGGIIETTDGGKTWRQTIFISDKVYGMEFDPVDSRIFYASGVWQGRGKVWKTRDGGENWEEIWTASADGPLVIAMAIDPADPRWIYISTSDKQVLKSENGGVTWRNIFDASDPVVKIGIDKINPDTVYLLTTDGLFLRSLNGGNSFEDLTSRVRQLNSSSGGFSVLEVDPNLTGGIYLAGVSGMIRSNDGGTNWQVVNVLSESDAWPVRALAIRPGDSREIIYTAGQTSYRSTDGGLNWSTFQFSTGKSFSNVEYSLANPNESYLTFSER